MKILKLFIILCLTIIIIQMTFIAYLFYLFFHQSLSTKTISSCPPEQNKIQTLTLQIKVDHLEEILKMFNFYPKPQNNTPQIKRKTNYKNQKFKQIFYAYILPVPPENKGKLVKYYSFKRKIHPDGNEYIYFYTIDNQTIIAKAENVKWNIQP
ncbi:MAG: hypothetical protein KatS3mg129_2298 [Leptospiraceae bacterium]|nr:MAG: hypothetical protein KatS3mg129_2298 [Leptospiraceae bacterium]